MLEQIPPFTIYNTLLKYRDFLQNAITEKEKKLKTAPEGHIRTIKHRNSFQYYLVTTRAHSNGTYLPRSKFNLVKKIFQRDYDKAILPELKSKLNTLNQFLQTAPDKFYSTYETFSQNKQTLITPVTLSDKQYTEIWLSREFTPKQSHSDTKIHTTSFGLNVRSKSEALIAEALLRNNIPFYYEYPLVTKSIGTIYPDFFCLNLRTRQEFYWEHFGMIDDLAYAISTTRKISIFQNEGFFPGKNLIISFETADYPITSHSIQKLIETYLK